MHCRSFFPNHHRTLDVLSSSARDSSPSLLQNIPHHVLAFLTERSFSSACRRIHEPTLTLFPRASRFSRLRRFYLFASTTFGSSVNERTSDWLATARSAAYHRQHSHTVNQDYQKKCAAGDRRHPGGPASAWQDSRKETRNNKRAQSSLASRRWTCEACSYENSAWRGCCHSYSRAVNSACRGGNGGKAGAAGAPRPDAVPQVDKALLRTAVAAREKVVRSSRGCRRRRSILHSCCF